MKKWKFAIVVQEPDQIWTLWLPEQKRSLLKSNPPSRTFRTDLEMLDFMSSKNWTLVSDIKYLDGLPRLIFKKRVKSD